MKRTVMGVDQQAAIEHGLDLKEIVFLDWFGHWAASGTMQHKDIDGEVYWWISRQKVLDDLPILGLKDGSRVSRFVSKLIEKGFLERRQVANTDNRGKRSYVRTTPKWSALSYDHVQKSERGNDDHVQNSAHETPRPRAEIDTSDTPSIRDTPTIRDRGESRGAKRVKHPSGVMVGETRYNRMCEERGKEAVDTMIDNVAIWCEAKGKKYTDYAAAAEDWFRRDEKKKAQEKKSRYANELPGTRDFTYERV